MQVCALYEGFNSSLQLSVKGRGAKDILKGFAKGIVKGVDEKILLSGQKVCLLVVIYF